MLHDLPHQGNLVGGSIAQRPLLVCQGREVHIPARQPYCFEDTRKDEQTTGGHEDRGRYAQTDRHTDRLIHGRAGRQAGRQAGSVPAEDTEAT